MEIMVVVVIIGIMTAMILPEMKGTYEDALLRSTSRELLNVFQLAASRSVSFNRAHRVRFNARDGHYAIEKRMMERSGETFIPLRDVPGGEGKLDTRIAIEFHRPGELSPSEADSNTDAASRSQNDSAAAAGGDTISFYPDGTADAVELLLRDRQGFRVVLRINPTTARVRVLELARQ